MGGAGKYPVEDTHWQEALALAEKLGLESLPDEKKKILPAYLLPMKR